MSDIKIGIVGAAGRMGRILVEAVNNKEGAVLSGACDRPESPFLGQDAGELAGVGNLGVAMGDDAAAVLEASDVVIDFTLPEATVAHAQLAAQARTPIVIGATGVPTEGRAVIEKAAQEIPVVWAPNYSVGVNLMFKMAAEAAKILGDDYDIEIIEMHHRHKVDAPSGTAVRLGETIADAVGRTLEKDAIYGREGHTGERDPRTIGFATLRGGDVVGDHTAMFAGVGERFEITHKASSRMVFAKGAVRAADWVVGKGNGLYDMRDILGFR